MSHPDVLDRLQEALGCLRAGIADSDVNALAVEYPIPRIILDDLREEIVRLRGERDKPAAEGRDQVEGFLRFYASEPYVDRSNETVRVRAVLLTTAADELSRLRSLVGVVSCGPTFAAIAKDLPRRSTEPEARK